MLEHHFFKDPAQPQLHIRLFQALLDEYIDGGISNADEFINHLKCFIQHKYQSTHADFEFEDGCIADIQSTLDAIDALNGNIEKKKALADHWYRKLNLVEYKHCISLVDTEEKVRIALGWSTPA